MNFLLHLIIVISMWLTTTLGYNLVFGRGKILYFGQTGISIVSAYTIILIFMASGSYVIAALAGLVAALIMASFFAWLALRLEPDGLGILTIAVHLALLAVVLNWSSLTRGALGIPRIPRMPGLATIESFAAATVMVAIIWALVLWRIDRGPLGRKLKALSEHSAHAYALGISKAKTYWLAFLVAGCGSFLSSLFYPQYIGLLHPNDYDFSTLIFYLMAVVAGGPGSVKGVALSTILLVFLKEGLRFVPLAPGILGPTRLLLFGLILIAAVYWRRKELFPMQRTV